MYRISELAEKSGVNKETIRYYERVDLLKKPHRTNAGYRMFAEENVIRIKFIKKMQDLGFTLTEIYKLLGVVDKDGERCNDMFNFVVNKIEDVKRKIRDLKRIEQIIFNLKENCPDEKSMYDCPIIETLMSEEK